jgi:hypothetical protein
MRYLILFLLMCGSAQAQYFSTPPNTILNAQLTNANAVMQNFNQVISDGNTVFNNFSAQIAAMPGAGIPAKAIVAFNLVACPTGWVTADGTGGTPDMRGYFVKATGGTVGTIQSSSQIIDHTHMIVGEYIASLVTSSYNATFGSNPVATGGGSFSSVGNMTSGSASETRPKNIALLYCMKS